MDCASFFPFRKFQLKTFAELKNAQGVFFAFYGRKLDSPLYLYLNNVRDEMSISYTRTFAIEAAHFNGQKAYDTYYRLRETADASNEEVLDLIKDVHGHNFRIVVEITLKDCDCLDQSGFAIDDEQLEQIIQRYDRINISVHDDFTTTGQRATTEQIANNYANLIFNKFDYDRLRFSAVAVHVHETDDIFATAVVRC